MTARRKQLLISAVDVEAGKCDSFSSHYSIHHHFTRIMGVARDYPQCEALAIDLIPMQSVYAARIFQ
jgi:hypothetical protein